MTQNISQFSFQPGIAAPPPLLVRGEDEVMRTWLSHGEPVVSICCATYNHADYLEDTLRGFIGQVTTFPFEIIVRDDASIDGTTDIVKKYAAQYPSIIRAVLENENQYSRGVRATPVLVNLARGQYVALCEGDDYWITSDKLEKQVQLLRDYPQASMSVARTVVCKPSEGQGWVCPSVYSDNGKDLQEFEDIQTGYFHTSTFVVRTDLYRNILNNYSKKIQIGDFASRLLLVKDGPFVLLKEIVSAYRTTGRGMWSSLDAESQCLGLLVALEGYYQHFEGDDYRKYFEELLYLNYRWMFRYGNWAFNKKSPFANFGRFLYFTFKARMDRNALPRLIRLLPRVVRFLPRLLFGGLPRLKRRLSRNNK